MTTRAIVVNFRTPDLTSAAVASVLSDDPSAEVVVVDNESGDGSSDRLRGEWPNGAIEVIDAGANLGFGQGVNLGSRGATVDALLVLNSDARVRRGAIAAMTTALQDDPTLGLVAPHVVHPDNTQQVDAFGAFPTLANMLLRTNRAPSDADSPDWVSGVGFLVRRSAFEAVGGFDEGFWMYFEDIDLCRRLRGAGWSIRRVREATIEHLKGASRVTSASQARQYAQSQRRYLERAGYSRSVVGTVAALRRPVDWYRGRG